MTRFSLLLLSFAACTGTAGPATGGDAAAPDSARPDARASTDSGRGGRADSGTADSGTASGDAGSRPSGSDAYRGRLLFRESFEDTSFSARGWYDSTGGALASGDNAPGGTGASLECRFGSGATGCAGGTPARHPIDPVDAVFLSFWVKHSGDWVGSGRSYHPHLFHFLTDLEGDYAGPAMTHLTLYVEHVDGRGMLALGDGMNVDGGCVLRNDGSFVGCGGDFDSYSFSEMRSVAACNGLVGDVDQHDCFPWSGSSWYSSRSWFTRDTVFSATAGPRYQGDWHHVEAYFELNSIAGGVGVVDGKIRYWFDGELQISSDAILFRTGARAGMRLDQFLMLPYIGDGSPRDQTMWIDEIEVYEGARP